MTVIWLVALTAFLAAMFVGFGGVLLTEPELKPKQQLVGLFFMVVTGFLLIGAIDRLFPGLLD